MEISDPHNYSLSNKHAWYFYKQMSHAFNDQRISASSLCKQREQISFHVHSWFYANESRLRSFWQWIFMSNKILIGNNTRSFISFKSQYIAQYDSLAKTRDDDKENVFDEEKVSRLIFALFQVEAGRRGTCSWNVISAQFIRFLLPSKKIILLFMNGEKILPYSNKITCLFLLKFSAEQGKKILDCNSTQKINEENDMFQKFPLLISRFNWQLSNDDDGKWNFSLIFLRLLHWVRKKDMKIFSF